MSWTDDDKFNFHDVELKSTNASGLFYLRIPKNPPLTYEVSAKTFKELLVVTANAALGSSSNSLAEESFDFMINQVEKDENIFTALLHKEWVCINTTKETK